MPLLEERQMSAPGRTLKADVKELRNLAYELVERCAMTAIAMRRIALRQGVANVAAQLGDDAQEFAQFWDDLRSFINAYRPEPVNDLT